MIDLSGVVEGAMRRHNLNQHEIARHLGVSQAAVSRWLSGRRIGSPSLVLRALRDLDRELSRPIGTDMRLYVHVCPRHGPVSTWADRASDVPPTLPAAAAATWWDHCLRLHCDPDSWRIAAGEPSPESPEESPVNS